MTSEIPRIGVSIGSAHRHDGPARMIERVQTAHAAGLASLTVGDHHNMAVPYAQNTPMLGRLLADWTDRPAGCLFLVPLWPPLLMAEQIGTLAAIHHSTAPDVPFIIQTGIGWGAEQFVNLDADMSRRGRMIDAAIPVVKALLAGETVSEPYFGLVDARVGLCATGPYEWWIGGTADVAIDRAARHGDVWYGAPGQDDPSIAAAVERYHQAGGTRVAMRRDAVVSADAAHAARRATELVERGYRGMTVDRLLVGDADRVADRLAELAALGCDDVIVRCASPDQNEALTTLRSLGTLV